METKLKKVKSYLHACKITGEKPLKDIKRMTAKKRSLRAADKIMTVCEASRILNKRPLNTANTYEHRYFPWHKIELNEKLPSGFGLSYDYCVGSATYSSVGSRLTVGSWKEAKYIGSHKEFIKLYEDFNR